VAQKQHLSPPSISSAAKYLLLEYDWPGNVRQLKNAIIYAMNVHKNGIIKPNDLPALIKDSLKDDASQQSATGLHLIKDGRTTNQVQSIREIEKEIIREVLAKKGYCISRAAESLGFSRATLYRKIKEYNLSELK
jgi:DNA-binding NtrC family response regulator